MRAKSRQKSYRPWTAGQRDSTLRNNRLDENAKKQKRLGVKYFKNENPPPEILKKAIQDGYCPWCDIDGWKVLSLHTSWSHGISAAEIREMAGLYKNTPTCLKEVSEYRAKLPHSKINIKKAQVAPKPKTKVLSEAGKKSARERLDKCRSQEQRILAARAAKEKLSKPHPCPVCGKILPKAYPIACSPECRKILLRAAQLKATQSRIRKIPIEAHATIAKRYIRGESSIKIAEEYQISPRYVRLISKRNN